MSMVTGVLVWESLFRANAHKDKLGSALNKRVLCEHVRACVYVSALETFPFAVEKNATHFLSPKAISGICYTELC